VTTILLIEDSRTFREEMKLVLEAAGYAVVAAVTGEEGLRVAADLRPSAVVVDGQLPGIDGATVVRRMRLDSVLRRTPCLLLTASGERTDELRALDAGADAYVRKDDDVDLILARLRAMLRSADMRPMSDSTRSQLSPKKILAVDDSPTYLEALASRLRQEGYEVVLARSGEEALELLPVQAVDCILLDLVMPGLSGQETCQRIKGSPGWRHVPLVMLTALDEREAMIQGINAGADDYISKSSDFEVLSARLRAQIRRKQFEDENRHIREQLLQAEIEAAEARSSRALAEARAGLLAELEEKNLELATANRELEAFTYSVSHDLRAPLRAIDGFSHILTEEHAERLGAEGRECLRRVRAAAQRMGELIDDLLQLSRLGRAELRLELVDLGAMARAVAEQLVSGEGNREVELVIREGIIARADPRLMRVALENLLGNALKFTAKRPRARIEFGVRQENGILAYFVRDNGAGFDMASAEMLFRPFQRLHAATEFEGTGIGLATVQRIVNRHGGRVWAEAAVGQGATFYFTL
jgi:DNA-binding response OmpR family regulator